MIRYSIFILVLAISCSPTAVETTPEYIASIETFRTEKVKGYTSNPKGPIEESDVQHLNYYAPDAHYACDCTIEYTSDAKPFEVETYAGKKKSFLKYAIAHCPIGNKKVDVSLYKMVQYMSFPGMQDKLFLPYMDHTNGEETYGGGRYIDLSAADIKDDKLLIDFNKSYNPLCAYSDGFNCPIPPPENHLSVEIRAGEKNFSGEKRQRKK